jgi:hypothetical protein
MVVMAEPVAGGPPRAIGFFLDSCWMTVESFVSIRSGVLKLSSGNGKSEKKKKERKKKKKKKKKNLDKSIKAFRAEMP